MKNDNPRPDPIGTLFIFLTYLCEAYKIDLLKEVENKIAHDAVKYPVAKAKGLAKKYTAM